MHITNDLIYIGVNDHDLDLFEGQYEVPFGMTYNSYLLLDEKVVVFDSVDINFTKEWLDNLQKALGNRLPDYLIVHHMEPDHSASLDAFLKAYPNTTIVGNIKTFQMFKQFFHYEIEHKLVVKENDTLDTGHHLLKFIFAPFVHWPEVMMTYDLNNKTIFTADAFGKFGTLDHEEPWLEEARRYYIGIVSKYGVQVNSLLNKLKPLEIERICSLHGPVLDQDIPYYVSKYQTWATYTPEEEGVLIAYSSIYGNTKKAALLLETKLRELGVKVEAVDLARTIMSQDIALAFKYSKLVIASTTYNNTLFPCLNTFVEGLIERNYQNRQVAIINNGTWSPLVSKLVKDKMANLKNLTFLEKEVKILSSLTSENIQEINELAELLK